MDILPSNCFCNFYKKKYLKDYILVFFPFLVKTSVFSLSPLHLWSYGDLTRTHLIFIHNSKTEKENITAPMESIYRKFPTT